MAFYEGFSVNGGLIRLEYDSVLRYLHLVRSLLPLIKLISVCLWSAVTLLQKLITNQNSSHILNFKVMIKQIIVLAISCMIGYSVSAENNIINVEKIGQGSPMILIHGMACSADVWTEVADYYKGRHEIHLVTINGFGNKETIEATHSLEAIRNALIAYVKTEKLNKPILMGHSMGGFLSLWAASEQPGLFGKIVSVDGLPYFPVLVMPGITPETAAPIVAQMQTGMSNQAPETARASQEMMIASMIATESKREKVVDMGLRSNAQVIGKAMGEMYTTDIRKEVENIKQPVLVLGSWAAYKPYGVTMESSRMGYKANVSRIPNATVAVAESAYHFIFYDEPEWFFKTVDGFLAN
jgi:pimeloyl-ACP methyl ester carboxylesterase